MRGPARSRSTTSAPRTATASGGSRAPPAGNVGINNTLMHVAQDDLPFGGVGPSGMGAYHGVEGFRAMSHAKGVFVQGRWNFAGLLHAPFGRFADIVAALTLGKTKASPP